VVGGRNLKRDFPSAELYDPATAVWTAARSMATARWHHTATLLPNGQVLVTGGLAELSSTYLASAELYESAPEMLDVE
jgi:hypothetical protein